MDPNLEQRIAAATTAAAASVTATQELAAYARGIIPATPPAPVPPAPPATPLWPNAPASLATFSDMPFTSADDKRGWELLDGNADLIDDASAPLSGPKVLRFIYPNGMGGGSAPGKVAHGLSGRRALYAGFLFKTNATWQGHNSNVNKLAHIFAQSGGGEMYLCFYGSPGGAYQLRVATQFTNGEQRWLDPNTSNPAAVRMGEWNLIEWLVDYASGTLKFGIGGKIVGNHSAVRFPSSGLDEFQFSPTWGGVGDQKRQTDTLVIDHALLKG